MTGNEFIGRIVSLSPRIYPMAARLLKNEEDANDAVQEIMLKLWKARNKLDRHPNINGFVFLTARNHCLDILKRERPVNSDLDLVEYIRLAPNESPTLEQKELFDIVRRIIDELPHKQSDIIMLRDIDGLEISEISAVTGISPEHTRVLLSRARKTIGKRLTEIYNYEYGKRG